MPDNNRALRRLSGFRDDFKSEEEARKKEEEATAEPKLGIDYLDSEFFQTKIVYYQKMLDEAITKGEDMTPHGSVRQIQRTLDLIKPWSRGSDRRFEGSWNVFLDEVVYPDETIQQIRQEEEIAEYQKRKDYYRSIGRGALIGSKVAASLTDYEMFDLDWLIECREKGFNLPPTVQMSSMSDGTLRTIQTDEWIRLLEMAKRRQSSSSSSSHPHHPPPSPQTETETGTSSS